LGAVAVADSRLFGPGGARLLGPGADAIAWLGSGTVGRVLIGLAQATYVVVVGGVAVVALSHRRLRLTASMAGGAVAAGAGATGVLSLLRSEHPDTVTGSLGPSPLAVPATLRGPSSARGAAAP